MRKQTTFLKYVTNSTPMRGGEDAAISIGQHRPIYDDAPALRTDQTGNRIDNRGLTRSRAAEKGCEPAPTAEMDVEFEGAEPMLDIDFEHGVKLRKGYGSCAEPSSRDNLWSDKWDGNRQKYINFCCTKQPRRGRATLGPLNGKDDTEGMATSDGR
jgi:hypothetical protein